MPAYYPPDVPDEQRVTESEILWGDLVNMADPNPKPYVIYTFGGRREFLDPNDPLA